MGCTSASPINTRCRSTPSSSTASSRALSSSRATASIPIHTVRRSWPTSCCLSWQRTSTMPRLSPPRPAPDEIADELASLQAGVPDARWVPAENFHVTLCFAGEVQGGAMKDLEEELSDIAGPQFALAVAGVEQFSTGKQPKALVALVARSDRLDW